MGSDSDRSVMEEAGAILEEFGIPYEIGICSAHRSPEKAARYARTAGERGMMVIIAGAGGAAHLAGTLAAHTTLPVIGVPLSSTPLQGLDALLSTVQMPSGVPVATMALDKAGARNAAYLAIQILALADSDLARKLKDFKEKLAHEVEEKDEALKRAGKGRIR
jgi:phosphoribosylaminoimidazole carboxylase PurE protein